jgi:DNA-binding CsgD family transcriptional regulator
LQGICAAYRGEHEAAHAAVEESVATLRQVEDHYALAIALGWQGNIAVRRGDDATARASWEETISLLRMVGQVWVAASAMGWLGELAYRQGDIVTARTWCEECVALLQRAGDLTIAVHHLAILGLVALAEGDTSRADACCRESLRICQETGIIIELPLVLLALAAIDAARGHAERAVRLSGASEAIGAAIGVPLTPFHQEALQHGIATLRETLGETTFAAAWGAGQAMSPGQAIAYALMPEEITERTPAPEVSGHADAPRPQSPDSTALLSRLTPREIEVLRLLAGGHTSKEIAATLHVAVPTANRHIANLYTKIGARGRADAIAFAIRLGLGGA